MKGQSCAARSTRARAAAYDADAMAGRSAGLAFAAMTLGLTVGFAG